MSSEKGYPGETDCYAVPYEVTDLKYERGIENESVSQLRRRTDI